MATAVKTAAPSRDAVGTYYSSKIEELEVEVRERMLTCAGSRRRETS